MSIKMSGYISNGYAGMVNGDTISDNASVLNQQMRAVEDEDLHQTMQKVIPMRDSLASSKRLDSVKKIQNEPGLPPMPATSQGKPIQGRAIEVQTDLSMLTMEQYSQGNAQGYNSKAFNKTHGFNNNQNQDTADKDRIS